MYCKLVIFFLVGVITYEASGAVCPVRYADEVGNIPGWGSFGVNETSARKNPAADLAACTKRCDDEPLCCSVEYKKEYCNLNKGCKPTVSAVVGQLFCRKKPYCVQNGQNQLLPFLCPACPNGYEKVLTFAQKEGQPCCKCQAKVTTVPPTTEASTKGAQATCECRGVNGTQYETCGKWSGTSYDWCYVKNPSTCSDKKESTASGYAGVFHSKVACIPKTPTATPTAEVSTKVVKEAPTARPTAEASTKVVKVATCGVIRRGTCTLEQYNKFQVGLAGKNKTESSCREACEKKVGCDVFILRSTDGKCYLFKKGAEVCKSTVDADIRKIYRKKACAVATCGVIRRGTCTLEQYNKFQVGLAGKNKTESSCREACEKKAGCDVFILRSTDGKCYLFKKGAEVCKSTVDADVRKIYRKNACAVEASPQKGLATWAIVLIVIVVIFIVWFIIDCFLCMKCRVGLIHYMVKCCPCCKYLVLCCPCTNYIAEDHEKVTYGSVKVEA